VVLVDDDDPQETSFDLGKTMGRSAEFRMLWRPMGKPWETHGKPMGNPWENVGHLPSEWDQIRMTWRPGWRLESFFAKRR